MGVYRTDYLMYGVKVDPKAVDWDKHEALIEGRPDAAFDLIYDGMSGQYAVAGKVIAKSDPYSGLEFTEITDDMLPTDTEGLQASIVEAFGPVTDKMRLFLFSHHS